jgi:HEAT repeat protein
MLTQLGEHSQMPKETREQRRIRHQITNLNSPEFKVSVRGEHYLISFYGVRALDQLLEACHHPNPVVRFRAAWALAYTHDSRAYETILRLADDPEERVRYDAVIALGILGDDRVIEPLTRMFLSNDETRPAGMGFGKMGLKAVPALAEVLHQGCPEVRWSVIQVLGNFASDTGDQSCMEMLHKCAKDPDLYVRENAEYWLDEIMNPEPQTLDQAP